MEVVPSGQKCESNYQLLCYQGDQMATAKILDCRRLYSQACGTVPLLHYAAELDPFLSLDCALALLPSAIQGKVGIKIFHLATLCAMGPKKVRQTWCLVLSLAAFELAPFRSGTSVSRQKQTRRRKCSASGLRDFPPPVIVSSTLAT